MDNKNNRIAMLEKRIHIMKTRGETERKGIIAKCEREIRKLKGNV